MYLSIEIIIASVIFLSILVYVAFLNHSKYTKLKDEIERKRHELDKAKSEKLERIKYFKIPFYFIEDEIIWETSYEERGKEGLLTELNCWMKKSDVIEKAKQNTENATTISYGLRSILKEDLKYFIIDEIASFYIKNRIIETINFLSPIISDHLREVKEGIEDFIDDPGLAFEPESQKTVSGIGIEIYTRWIQLQSDISNALRTTDLQYTEECEKEIKYEKLIKKYQDEHSRLIEENDQKYLNWCKKRDIEKIEVQLAGLRESQNA